MKFKLVLLMISTLICGGAVRHIDAAANGQLIFNGASNTGGECRDARLSFTHDYDPIIDDARPPLPSGDAIILQLTDANGVQLDLKMAWVGIGANFGNDGSHTYEYFLRTFRWFEIPTYEPVEITSVPVTLRMYDVVQAVLPVGPLPRCGLCLTTAWLTHPETRLITSLTVNPADYIPDCARLPVGSAEGASPRDDGRIATLGMNAVVYIEDQRLMVYGIDANGRGFPAVTVTAEDLAPYPAKPAENTLILSTEDGRIAVYRLTTGELQVNVGPDAEGKVQVATFSGLDATGMNRRYEFNVYR